MLPQRSHIRSLSNELSQHQSTPWGQPLYCYYAEGPDVRREDIEMVGGLLREARSDLTNRHVGGLQERVDELLDQHALPIEASPALDFGLPRIRVKRLEKAREWLEHGPVDDAFEAPSARSEVFSLNSTVRGSGVEPSIERTSQGSRRKLPGVALVHL